MSKTENISSEIGKTLTAKKKTLAVAESCTGGYISHLITSVSGSSAYYMGGIISYDNKIKTEALGVRKKTIKKHGAVSAECASEMVLGIKKEFKADYAIATTGIAGPAGAVKGKPIGTVYIALAHKKKVVVERFKFKGSRKSIIEQSSQKALQMFKNLLT